MRDRMISNAFAGNLRYAVNFPLFSGFLLLAACSNTDDAIEMSVASSDDSLVQSDKEDFTPADSSDAENSESSADDTESSMSKSDEETLEVPVRCAKDAVPNERGKG